MRLWNIDSSKTKPKQTQSNGFGKGKKEPGKGKQEKTCSKINYYVMSCFLKLSGGVLFASSGTHPAFCSSTLSIKAPSLHTNRCLTKVTESRGSFTDLLLPLACSFPPSYPPFSLSAIEVSALVPKK